MALVQIVKPPSTPPWDKAEAAAAARHEGLVGHLLNLIMGVHETHRLIAHHAPKAPTGRAQTLSALTPWKVARKDYHYLRIHAAAPLALSVDVGAGPMTMALRAGWNNVDFPDGTSVTCAAGGNVYVELTDYYPPAQ